MCWVPPPNMEEVCTGFINVGQSTSFNVNVGDKWNVRKKSGTIVQLDIVGGKHIYHLSEYFIIDERFNQAMSSDSVVHVHSPPACVDYQGYDVLGITFRDAIRRAAFRHSLGLCLCGEFNTSSSFTADEPNDELPIIFNGDQCQCDSSTNLGFHMWVPCNFLSDEPRQLLEEADCE